MGKEIIIGKTMGIYNVLYECDFKQNDGHKMFRVKCAECGWEGNMQKRHILKAKKCTHVNRNGGIRKFNYFMWDNDRLFHIYNGMKDRCYNHNCDSYRYYGGKGITVCDEWINDPSSFISWQFSNGYDDSLTIDRLDENEGYNPDNCRWVSLEDNSRYKQTTTYIRLDGRVFSGRELASVLGLGTNTINKYIRKYGLQNTTEFVRRYMKNPTKKPKNKQSYYNLYMNQNESGL